MSGGNRSKVGRRQLVIRFRLASMLFLFTALSALFTWIAPSVHREFAWNRTTNPIRRAGGSVAWFAETSRSPDTAASISLKHSTITDDDLAIVGEFPNVETLDLRNTRVTDLGLKHLAMLRSLQWVDLRGTRVTDEGVADLKRSLPNVEISH